MTSRRVYGALALPPSLSHCLSVARARSLARSPGAKQSVVESASGRSKRNEITSGGREGREWGAWTHHTSSRTNRQTRTAPELSRTRGRKTGGHDRETRRGAGETLTFGSGEEGGNSFLVSTPRPRCWNMDTLFSRFLGLLLLLLSAVGRTSAQIPTGKPTDRATLSPLLLARKRGRGGLLLFFSFTCTVDTAAVVSDRQARLNIIGKS